MDTRASILALSQSEKIKAGLIWVSQAIEMITGLPEQNREGAEKLVIALVGMVSSEIQLGRQIAPHDGWEAALKHINTATVMLHSHVVHDAPFHLSRALSQVTNVGQAAMTRLGEAGLL